MKYLNIVWGNQDKITPVDQTCRGQKLIKHSVLHIFEKGGHMPQVDWAEEFYGPVLGFLEAC